MSFDVEHQYTLVGQHLVACKDRFKVRHCKLDDGQLHLKNFLSHNSIDSLQNAVKGFKFAAKVVKTT